MAGPLNVALEITPDIAKLKQALTPAVKKAVDEAEKAAPLAPKVDAAKVTAEAAKAGKAAGDKMSSAATTAVKGHEDAFSRQIFRKLMAESGRAGQETGARLAMGAESAAKGKDPFKGVFAKVPAEAQKAGKDAGEKVAAGVEAGAKSRNPFRGVFSKAAPEAAKAGSDAGGKFRDGAEKAGKKPLLASLFSRSGGDAGAAGSSAGKRFAEGAIKHIKTVAVAAAGAFAASQAVDFAKDSVSKFQSVAMEVNAIKRTTGAASAEEASKLRFAFQQTGLGATQAQASMGKYSRAVQQLIKEQEKGVSKAQDRLTKNKEEIAALQASGKKTDEHRAKIAKLAKENVGLTSVVNDGMKGVEAWGVKLTDANGKMIPIGKTLPGIADKFKGMKDGAEKNALAMQLFGKAGLQMIPFLNKGAKGIEELGIKAGKTGNVVNDKMLKSVLAQKQAEKDWNSSLDGLKIQLGAALMPAMTAATNLLREKMIPAFRSASGWVKDHQSQIKSVSSVLLNVVAPIGAAVGAFMMFQKITAVVKGVQLAFALLKITLLMNPFTAILSGVIALGIGLKMLYDRNEGFRNAVNRAWAAIKSATGAVVGWFTQTAAPAIAGFFKGIGSGASSAWNWVKSAWNNVKDFTSRVWNGIGKFFKDWWESRVALFKLYTGMAGKVLAFAWNTIKQVATKAWNSIAEFFKDWWDSRVALFKAVLGTLKRVLSDAWDSINRTAKSAWDGLKRGVDAMWKGVQGAFSSGVATVKRTWEQIQEIAKKPIAFVVNSVIAPFARKFNDLSSKIGGPTLPVPAFNEGGKVPAQGRSLGSRGMLAFAEGGTIPGTPPGYGRDNLLGVVDGIAPVAIASGEVIHSNRTGDTYGRDTLEKINQRVVPPHVLRQVVGAYANGGRVNINGKALDQDTWGKIQRAQGMVGWGMPIMQGSWSNSVKASAGTHGGSGVADLSTGGRSWDAAVAALRAVGLIAWHRTPAQGFGHHIHLVNPAMAHAGMAPGAVNQIASFLRGANGLAGGGKDDGPRGNAEALAKLAGDLKGAGGGGGGFGGFLSSVLGAVLGPAKDGINKLIDKIPGTGTFSQLAKGGAHKLVDTGFGWLTNHDQAAPGNLDGSGGHGHVDASATAAPGAWQDWWKRALAVAGPGYAKYEDAARIVAQHESGFNPTVQNNWDINAKRGNPSGGLMQFIKTTFAAHMWPGHNKFLDPVDQILAFFRYSASRYGSPDGVPGVKAVRSGQKYRGYAEGGQVLKPLLRDTGGRIPQGLSLIQNNTGRDELALNPRQEEELLRGRSTAGAAAPLVGTLVTHTADSSEVITAFHHAVKVARAQGGYAHAAIA